MKKVIKWLAIIFGAIILLIVIAGIAVIIIVDKEMITSQMENALNRHVEIGDIDVGILSAISGIEVKDVRISNYKTKRRLKALKGKPVSRDDLFVGLKAFNFKIQFLPLLSKKFILNELVLYEPAINIIKYRNGSFNFDDLVTPKSETPKKKEKRKKKVKEAKKAEPFTADDLPIEITVGKVGIEKGQIKFVDQKLGQTFQIYNLTTLIHSIDIDPKDLKNRDSVGLKVEMGIKTIGRIKTGSVKSFDIGLNIDGNIIPFDKKTRIAEPEITLKSGLPYGKMTGLQIFEEIKSQDGLSKYCGKLNFLQKDITWENAYVDVWYKSGTVKLKSGKIPTDDYVLNYGGIANINTKMVNLDLDMLLNDKHQDSIRKGIEKNVEKEIKGEVKKYVKAEDISEIALKKIVNKDGKVYLKFKVTGAMSKPDAKLVHPKLPSIKSLIKDSVGEIKNIAKEKVKGELKKATKKVVSKGKEKAMTELDKKTDKKKKELEDKLKKQFKF